MNSLLGDTFSRKNNTHGSQLHDRDPQFASQILGAMTQSCYIGTRDIRSRVIRGPYCINNIQNAVGPKNLRLFIDDKALFMPHTYLTELLYEIKYEVQTFNKMVQ